MHWSFLFLSANTPWVYALADRLGRQHAVHAVRFFDWRVYRANRPTWPPGEPSDHLARTTRVMPTGYTGVLEPVLRPVLAWMIRRWRQQLKARSGSSPTVVAPYPYLVPWVRDVPGQHLVYFNLDDYALYRPERADRIRDREDELIQRAHRTLCLSVHQVEHLRDRHPDRADRILHFPLGVTDAFLNPSPETPPAPRTISYVGNLTDRVDWDFVNNVIARCPSLTFRFVGSADPTASETAWQRARTDALQRKNVDFVGRVPQEAVTGYYWSAAVNWIPYATDHPFNRASCPTKVMDGIGSGRPVVSTDIPECRLYPDWINIVRSPEEAAAALRNAVEADHDPSAQMAFARSNTWANRAETFGQILKPSVTLSA